jgi:hypothetical protein
VIFETLINSGQVLKSKRWMPWQLEPKKDVVICDKPRGVDKQTLIRGFPNGETQLDLIQLFLPEYIGQVKGTRGSETSQYPQEEKTKVIPLVVASERGRG